MIQDVMPGQRPIKALQQRITGVTTAAGTSATPPFTQQSKEQALSDMYPPAGHEGTISQGQRPISRSKPAPMTKSPSARWDDSDPTVVARENPQSTKKYTKNDLSTQSPPSNSPRPKNRIEIYACRYDGCQRKFVNQAELRNHEDVMQHCTTQHDSAQQPEAIEPPIISLADTTSPPYPASQRSTSQDGEKTIKPIPITAAALRALNSTDESDLARSMHELSISGSDGRDSSASLMSFDTTYSATEEYDDAPFSDVAEPDSPHVLLPARILLALWAKFLHDFLARNRPAYRQKTNHQAAQNQHASDSKMNKNIASPQTPSVASSARASKRKENFDDDDGQENGRRPSKIRPPRNQVTPENRPFACPFNKYNSYTFGGDASNSSYHTCSTWHDVKTAYLKQHIVRNHCLPEYYCPRCGDDYKNNKVLGEHLRANPPCEVKDIDSQKLPPHLQQELGLRTRNAVSTDRRTYWYKVYDTIFGSEARRRRPVEPYYEGPSHEILDSFLHFSELRIPDVIRESRRRLNMNPEEYNDQNVDLVRTILHEASQSFMSDRRAAQAQSLKHIHEQNTPIEDVGDDSGERTITVKHEQKVFVDRSAPRGPAKASHSWHQLTGDFPQSPEEAFRQQPPHASPYAQGHMYSLSTGNIDAPLPQGQIGPNGYDHSVGLGYPSFTAGTFDNALFLNSEFMATMETSDLYGSGSIDENEISGFGFNEPPSRRERRLT